MSWQASDGTSRVRGQASHTRPKEGSKARNLFPEDYSVAGSQGTLLVMVLGPRIRWEKREGATEKNMFETPPHYQHDAREARRSARISDDASPSGAPTSRGTPRPIWEERGVASVGVQEGRFLDDEQEQ